mgnify:CR=1 FL=1
MNKDIYEKLKNNSIGENDIHKVKDVKKGKTLVKTIVPLLAIFMIVSVCGINVVNNYQESANTKYEFNYDLLTVSDSLFIYTDGIRSKMYLAHLDPNKPHTIEEYKTIHLTNEDIFGIYQYTSRDKEETEKAIKSLGYDDWNDYLIKQNCINKNNEADFNLWVNIYYQKLYDSLKRVK